MNGECYFCHGLVFSGEPDDLLLDEHADHEVYMHRQCAVGHNVVEESSETAGEVEVLCPECGAVEVYRTGLS
ncbi:hypothetical protein KTS45_18560 [Halomicroarcula limicola]|uniref:Uncharacterized protein n=1 Tax=Haloarcula limicola TaxID=1429915 RepID=A0A8J7YGT2_9EURY|nr:hypothetical protein [Halomicroarcula limicola]MBV0926213.1 hypothetical protein [Halomicroarcula limicola]